MKLIYEIGDEVKLSPFSEYAIRGFNQISTNPRPGSTVIIETEFDVYDLPYIARDSDNGVENGYSDEDLLPHN